MARFLVFRRERNGLDRTGAAHALEDQLLAPPHAAGVALGVRRERVRERGGERCRLGLGQVRGAATEIMACCGLGAEDGRPPFGHIEIQLEDPVLLEKALEPSRNDRLFNLADCRPRFAEVEILGELLRDGAATTNPFAIRAVIAVRREQRAQIIGVEDGEIVVAAVAEFLAQRAPVDAAVLVETGVLGHHHRAAQMA
jgi:hypothetical protein